MMESCSAVYFVFLKVSPACFLLTASGKIMPSLSFSCWSMSPRKALSFVCPCSEYTHVTTCATWNMLTFSPTVYSHYKCSDYVCGEWHGPAVHPSKNLCCMLNTEDTMVLLLSRWRNEMTARAYKTHVAVAFSDILQMLSLAIFTSGGSISSKISWRPVESV